VAIFQPQISTWKGNEPAGRFAVGIRSAGSKDEAYGVVSFTARTEIDKLNRLVTLEDLEIGKVNFPTQSAKEVEYLALLKKHLPEKAKTIPLGAQRFDAFRRGGWGGFRGGGFRGGFRR
jgi:hypothetical protein